MSASSLDRVTTERMVCERIEHDHVDELARLLLDPRVQRTLWPHFEEPGIPEVIESVDDRVRHWQEHGFGLWLLRDRTTGEMVGRGGLQHTDATGTDEIEVGWAIVPERWGQGLATELAQESLEVAFGPLGLDDVIAFTLADNRASRRVMEKAGFSYERDIVHVGLPHVLYRRTR